MRLVMTLALLLAAAPLFTLAQVVVPSPDDPNVYLSMLLDAFQGKNWFVFGALLTVGIVWAVRKWGVNIPKIGAFIATSRGGAAVSLVTGLVTQAAITAITGTPLGSQTIVNGLLAALAASGGWVVLRRLIFGDELPSAKVALV